MFEKRFKVAAHEMQNLYIPYRYVGMYLDSRLGRNQLRNNCKIEFRPFIYNLVALCGVNNSPYHPVSTHLQKHTITSNNRLDVRRDTTLKL